MYAAVMPMRTQYRNHWTSCLPIPISPPMTVIIARGPALNFSWNAGSLNAAWLVGHGTM